MKDKFIQSDESLPIIKVYENVYGNVFIGNISPQMQAFDEVAISFTPDEAILFAKYVLKTAKEIKKNDGI